MRISCAWVQIDGGIPGPRAEGGGGVCPRPHGTCPPSVHLRHLGLVAALLLPAADAAQPLPSPVIAQLQELIATCRDVGGRPEAARVLRRADLTGDGITDYIIDVAGFECAGAWAVFGERAKAVTVLVGDGRGGAAPGFEALVWGVRVKRGGAGMRLWLVVAAADCGLPPAPDFASERFCERPLVWNAAARRFLFAPLASARMLQ